MTRTAIFVIGLVLIALFLTMCGGALPAYAHNWYDYACCNENDCRQTTLGEVQRRETGWYVVPTGELIPFDDRRIRQSLDPLIHRCVIPSSGATRCLYVALPGG